MIVGHRNKSVTIILCTNDSKLQNMRQILFVVFLLIVGFCKAQEIEEPVLKTNLLFEDSCTGSWKDSWMLDGERAHVINSSKGMELIAGPEAGNDTCHAVLWTKNEFSGHICIEYEYTRTDSANRFVNILYFMATGNGSADYPKDISLWNNKRRVPHMRTYFNHMNAYHISYAAFPVDNDGSQNDYIRLRRYMPDGRGLKNTDVPGDVFNTGLFKYGVSYHIMIYLVEDAIEMRIQNLQNKQELNVYKWDASMYPSCLEGRIGLRHMYTRNAIYKNFKVWQLSSNN